MRIYVDTSVINGLYVQDKRIKEITEHFFRIVQYANHILYGSEVVAIEIKSTSDLEKRKLFDKNH